MRIKSLKYTPMESNPGDADIHEVWRLVIEVEMDAGRNAFLLVTWHGYHPDYDDHRVYMTNDYTAQKNCKPIMLHVDRPQTKEQVEDHVITALGNWGFFA